jgi:CRP/FNR family transcriptional activator FtrB
LSEVEMKASDLPELRSLALFAAMSDANFESLTARAYIQTFPPLVDLIVESDPADFLHVVLDGSVELFASWGGRETVMATVQPVTAFILAASLRDAPYLMSGRTLEKSRLVLLPSGDVRAVFERDSGFARAVVHDLSGAYREVVKTTKNLKLRSSLERLANYLLHRQIAAGALSFTLPIEKRRIASFLGMTPENLSRAIRALQSYGVRIDGADVTIGDLAALQELARPTPLIDDPAH